MTDEPDTADVPTRARRPARPAKITDRQRIGRVVAALREGAPMRAALAAGPIGKSTHYEWMKRAEHDRIVGAETPYVAYALAVDEAQQAGELALVRRVAQADDWRGAAWILERSFGWTQQVEVGVTRREMDREWLSADERHGALVEALLAYQERHSGPPQSTGGPRAALTCGDGSESVDR
jgi:hypothetical protein